MILKVFISKVFGNLYYEVKNQFPGAKLYFADQLSIKEFRSLHTRNLFSKKGNINVLIGVDHFKQEHLLPLIDQVHLDVVWTVESLPKNTKLYKKLNSTSSIDDAVDLYKANDIKKFTNNIGKLLKLNLENYPRLLDSLPADKSIIFNELQRIKTGEEVIDPSLLNENLGIATLNDDVFMFIDNLFSLNLERSYLYAVKLSRSMNPIALNVILSKKLDSMLYLSANREDEALKYWRHFGPNLWETKKLSKNLGVDKLLQLKAATNQQLGNLFDDSPLMLRLSKLIFDTYQILDV